jgi:DNA polymerase sigma
VESQLKSIDYVQALIDVRNAIRHIAVNQNMEGIFGARVPLLKFKDNESQIECDISINNTTGIPNSKLTRLYCEIDQRVHIMIKYLRHIFKQSGLLFSDQGCLSTYSIILMVIAFLQNQSDPILPNLQEKAENNKDVAFYSVTKNKFGRVN